ncbi:MAG: DUF5682 family protein [Candidatus Thiodiazotropha sp.]|jgi:hypothetical protein
MAKADIHYYGIRHHGPGSCKRLMAALNRLQPQKILIEGPADCDELLPLLGSVQMRPPVALLAYAAERPECAIYYPFADYSPEYQACRWALQAKSELHYIDLPVNIQLAQLLAQLEREESDSENEKEDHQAPAEQPQYNLAHDPIGALAKAAGYEEGESWWNDLIEQNSDDDELIFAAVDSAMDTLRASIVDQSDGQERDLVREAHMRLEISKHAKGSIGPVAVVCGAWHVPALKQKVTAKDDRARIKTLPGKLGKNKVKTTWVPWTSPRFAEQSGYGAGVRAPMWYQHLWLERDNQNNLEHWFGKVAVALREQGHIVSTASVIEAVRLSQGLAAVRNRPSVGFEEVREAVIACICFGEALMWRQLEQKLLLGDQVGEVPGDAPLVPLLEDLHTQQKRLRLKPEALPKELSLDLRSDSGLGRSILLHRLNMLEIPWGVLSDAGRSRGTFRERWRLCWEPEFAVRLVENMIYGSTIEQAANKRMSQALQAERHLQKLAEGVMHSLEAQLNSAADLGLARLEERAAHTSDCIELLESLPALINLSRYGTARALSLGHIEGLIVRLTIQSAVALPYACRNLDEEEAQHYRGNLSAAHKALELTDYDPSVMAQWWEALQQIAESPKSARQLAGLTARLLYQGDRMSAEALQGLLSRALSPAVPPREAAHFFDGFFTEAVQNLLYDAILLNAIERWLISLDEASFTEFLPLFRRIFADLDAMERKRLVDTLLQGREQAQTIKAFNPQTLALWPAHLQCLGQLIKRDKNWCQ